MLRGSTNVFYSLADVAATELKRLIPLLPSKERDLASSSRVMASLIAATAFSSTTTQSALNHSRGCPVLAKQFPLSRIGREPSFAARPCPNCVRERIHYVASTAFCHDFERQCTVASESQRVPFVGNSGDDRRIPKLVRSELERSFSSISAFKGAVKQHTTGAMSPGRVWVVYTPPMKGTGKGGIDILNLPGCRVPLVHGLWPLAVINLTEELLCRKMSFHESSNTAAAADVEGLPAWSHAARSRSAIVARIPGPGVDGCFENIGQVHLSAVQEAIAKEALQTMNWEFVEQQLMSAMDYYASAARVKEQHEYRKGKEHIIAMRAMSNLRDSGAVIHATDLVTVQTSHGLQASVVDDPHLAKEGTMETPVRETRETPSATPLLADGIPQTPDIEGSSVHDSVSNAASAERTREQRGSSPPAGEPHAVQQADGTWEYRYDNGEVTKVLRDGTKVFQAEGLKTTVFTNGDTLFEYANNTSILDRADGVRITTYADGTKTEERLQ